MTVINEKLTSAIHAAIEAVNHNLDITIVQPKNEHNIPWHYINEEYLFKVAGSDSDISKHFHTEDQEAMKEALFVPLYASTAERLASIVRSHLCLQIGFDLLDWDIIERYEKETGEELEIARCHEDEEMMEVGHRLIATVQMLEWHYDNEQKANNPFYEGDITITTTNTPW